MIETIIAISLTSLVVCTLAILIHKHSLKDIRADLQIQLQRANEAERQVHIKEMEYLAERNKAELAHAEALSQARSSAFEEGRKQGRAEQEHETSVRLAEQRNEFAIRLQSEKEQAVVEAKDNMRKEYELQTKLFSVRISPYVEIITDGGFIRNTHEAKIGYQYQLLVNGIPAFQPHVFIERHEKIQQIDESAKKNLLLLAETCADAAVATYLGTNPQFAKLAPSVFEQNKK